MPNVLEITKQYLVSNGYEGLYNVHGECGCEVSDLSPGDCFEERCEPGHKIPCTGPSECPTDGSCEWHIGDKE